MALYRTYRPATLAEVVGQDHVTGPLRRALENDRMHHAYLFSGPRGCGKTSTARIVARSLNCEQGPTPDPCGVCQSCVDLAANGPGSIDVIELDAASHGKVEDTRELRERAMFAPVASRYKIFIIDEAHMVTNAGFNALLKLVEEPPPHVRFIFATTEADKVLPTIRSRTHNYTFRLVPVRLLQQHLADVCEREGVAADSKALALIARAGEGSVRDSMSILGQVIAGSGPEGVTYADTVSQLGVTDRILLDETIEALLQQDGGALFRVIDRVIDAGHDPRTFVTDLLGRFRDLIVLKNVPDALDLIDAPEDEVAREVAQSERFGMVELTRAADIASATVSGLRNATAPRLHLELMAARLLLPAVDADITGLRAQMDQLERRVASGPAHPTAAPGPVAVHPVVQPAAHNPVQPAAEPVAQPAAQPAAPARETKAPARATSGDLPTPPKKPRPGRAADPEPASAPAAHGAPAAPQAVGDLDQFVSMWPAVLEALKLDSRVAWVLFESARPVSISAGALAIAVGEPGKLSNISSSKHDERLRQAVIDVMQVDVRIDVVLAPDRVGPLATSAVQTDEPDTPSLDDTD
ncbi:MAG: DNA polymerase III subunit gamma and tau, partial [Candidatus Nanopelagicales bacterium]|nr:DNA polymerase III subunit gamma and tau [Candidatus Nanopelagicales bacterium]